MPDHPTVGQGRADKRRDVRAFNLSSPMLIQELMVPRLTLLSPTPYLFLLGYGPTTLPLRQPSKKVLKYKNGFCFVWASGIDSSESLKLHCCGVLRFSQLIDSVYV